MTSQAELAQGGTDFDPSALHGWLETYLGSAVKTLTLKATEGGMSNPTYFVTADGFRAVLRKQPGMKLAKSAHAIDREYRVIGALAATDVPVPALYHFEDDASIVGTPFYLMEWLEGRVLTEYAMPGMTPDARAAHYAAMCETMAKIHRLDFQALGLGDFGRPGNYFKRQLSRWSMLWDQYKSGKGATGEIDRMIEWLEPRIPDSEQLALCHGDFRVGNIMFHTSEPRVIGVLDWELSTLGHPLVDAGFNTQAWHMPPDANGGIAGLDLKALGIPAEADYLARYYGLSHSAETMTDVHRVFAMFRAAVGSAGVAIRGEQGNSTLPDSVRVGWHLARTYAAQGLAIADSSKD